MVFLSHFGIRVMVALSNEYGSFPSKTWKLPKCPTTEEWIKKMWYIYTMEYYSAIKKNELMPFAATWMDLEVIILSEVSQTEKDKYHMISLICGI